MQKLRQAQEELKHTEKTNNDLGSGQSIDPAQFSTLSSLGVIRCQLYRGHQVGSIIFFYGPTANCSLLCTRPKLFSQPTTDLDKNT